MLITKIGSSYSHSEFPEKFSNQLYFSENVNLGEYTYKSSYSINLDEKYFIIYQKINLIINGNILKMVEKHGLPYG